MEQIGWDFTNERVGGKNVFVFRDTNHTDEGIQDRIYDEVYAKIQQKKFGTLFVESWSGDYTLYPRSWSEQHLRNMAMQNSGRCLGAHELLNFKRASDAQLGRIKIYGVDQEEIFEKHRDVLRLYVQLASMCNGRVGDEERAEFDALNKRCLALCKRRSLWAAESAVNQMDLWGLKSAGLVFGDAHYDVIADHLRRRGVGVVSYFPGRVEYGLTEIVEYFLRK
jgi:hypothetical protein